MDSSEKDSSLLHTSRSTTDAEPCSASTGLEYLRTGTLVISAGFPCQDLSVAGKRTGLSGSRSSLLFDLIGWLSRTSRTRGNDGCPSCGAAYSWLGMPACLFNCPPLKLAQSISDDVSSLLPTPTASSYGSCRGGGAGRVGRWRKSLQSLGILHPEDWERMMGFPPGWTDVSSSATPSAHTRRSSSRARSK